MGAEFEVDLLSRLRERVGNHVVDALIDAGTLTAAPLAREVRRLVEDLLAWEPALPSSAPVVAKHRVEAHQFLSANLPQPIASLSGDASGTTQGATETTLDALARYAFPAFLAASDPRDRDIGWHPMRLRSTAGHADAVAAMRSEEALTALWTAEILTTSFAQAGTLLKLYDPVELIVHGAWRLCLLRGTWTVAAFREAVRSQLAVVRSASSGSPARVSVFLGFGDARVENEVAESDVVVRPYHGSLQSWLLQEGDRLDEHGGGFVVEQSVPWTFTARNAVEAPEGPSIVDSFDDHDLFTHWGDCLATAIGFSRVQRISLHQSEVPGPLPARPSLRWILNADPLVGSVSHHFSQGWRARKDSNPWVDVDSAVLKRARGLATITDEATRIAIGRLSASLTQQRGWKDGLVDAVIAWEAMSGDCKDAVSLKVSSVIAHLISDSDHRNQIRSEVKKLYGVRSSVLHGGVRRVESVKRDAAVLVGLAALRALVDEHPSLIGKKDRFEMLCLDSHS